ncbi:mediator of DNA damage checkpoint protein 1 [Phtheirospermum japonicum]|uniref:Mediator of DNA damage checkpoint protein 1 n=1 Tax=Phtheirospermum japonicum TaxID=374723 RepID=A0A830C2U9_9LAMI|nr:mediator of DNA damage checkpoint protein 1 [Phtheirospermum japonicum]
MGASEDDDNRNDSNSRINNLDVDSRDFETQHIDSQYPGGDLEDDEIDDFRYLTDTMPVDESYLFGDAFETQFLNLAGETQVVDIGDETQVLDDFDCMKNMPIDFLNDFYTETVATDSKCEGATKTEAFFETQVLSQDADSAKIDDVDSIGLENTAVDYPPRQCNTAPSLFSGSFSGGFTSIRSASMRASGLAARERGAANRNNLCPTSSDKSSVEQETCNKDNSSPAGCSSEPSPKHDDECLQTDCIKDTEGPGSSNKCKIASATVRKLFEDDEFSEIGQRIEPDIINDADDNLDVATETCLGGLSYADSQEPGELSQAHALEVVDKFLDLNVMDFDERVGTIVGNVKKSKVVDSGAKGPRDLAKKSSVLENPDGERGIYDWDDNREDDGGGDFFLKKKELFFEKKRCHTEPRKPKGDEKEKKCTKNKLQGSAISDSGPILHKLRATGRKSVNFAERVVQKNLVKDLEEQLNVGPEPHLVEKEKNEDLMDLNDIIDPDTQMVDAKAKKCTKKNLKGLAYSDSVSMLRKLRSRGKTSLNCGEKVLQKNVVKDLDEQLNVGPEPNLVEEEQNEAVTDADDIIGPTTQMAVGKEKKCTKKKLKGSAYSDSGSTLCKLKARGKMSLNCGENMIQKNLVKNLDEQLNVGPELNFVEEKNEAVTDANDIIGSDTEMADGKEKKCTKNKLKGSAYSDSGSTLRKLRSREKKSLNCGENVMQKNLVKDVDEQLNVGPELNFVEEKNEAVTDVKDIIGPDTQMADGKEKKCTKNKSKGSVYSDSGSMLRKLRSREKKSLNCGENVMQKNLVKDLDEQLTVGPEPNLVEEDKNEDVTDVGPDTQLAAEAMETLCFELLLADDNNSANNPDKAKATCEKEMSDITVRPEEHLTTKRPFRPSIGVVTRQAKQIKRAPVIITSNGSSFSSKQSDLTSQRSEKKRHLEDHLDFSVPVAHRTRKSTQLHHSKAAAKTFDNRDEANRAISARVTRKSTAFKEKMVGSNGPSAIDNKLPEKRPRQENIVEADTQYNNGRLKRSKIVGANFISTRSGRKFVHQNADNGGSRHDAAQNASNHTKVGEKSDSEKLADAVKAHDKLEASPLPHATVCRTPMNNASPICMGDEYRKQSCRKNLSRSYLITEINNVITGSPGPYSGTKESRKRKDITSIRVLFSQHLDEDVIKHQKKILAKLGGAVATFMSDATHFVAEEFVRTRNMLEAIASGKPVVTRLWLESCGQASCLIDEKNYILRDSRKEKEFGFCLPDSLSRACQHPILQGQKVLVTPNTKPGKDILANLVKAVHGLAIERVGRTIFNDEKLPDDLLILSCEEDYDACVPFLEKGGAIYSSELLLNGIVKQKLEYERHRLFEDHVKRTRSTIWMKKKNGYLPVTKCK